MPSSITVFTANMLSFPHGLKVESLTLFPFVVVFEVSMIVLVVFCFQERSDVVKIAQNKFIFVLYFLFSGHQSCIV